MKRVSKSKAMLAMVVTAITGGHARNVSAKQPTQLNESEQKFDTSILEAGIKFFELFQGDTSKVKKFIMVYDPSKNYEALFQKLVKEIAALDFISYGVSHSLGELKFKAGNFYFSFSNQNQLTISKKEQNFLVFSDGCYQIYKFSKDGYSNGKTYSFEDEETKRIKKSTRNLLFYLAYYLIDSQDLFMVNKEWKAKAWKKPIQNVSLLTPISYDIKTGEFIFSGTAWCEPCKEVTTFLLTNKIKFREKDVEGTGTSTPSIYYDQKFISGNTKIIEVIRTVYGIPKN